MDTLLYPTLAAQNVSALVWLLPAIVCAMATTCFYIALSRSKATVHTRHTPEDALYG